MALPELMEDQVVDSGGLGITVSVVMVPTVRGLKMVPSESGE